MKPGVNVREATHVKVDGRIEKIASKWGIRSDGGLNKPSEGGFGVVTESGRRVSMWEAHSYLKEESGERTKVFVIAHLPANLDRKFIQHVRNFDTANPGCHFEMGVEGPDLTMGEMVERLRVEPALTFTKIFERAKLPKLRARAGKRP